MKKLVVSLIAIVILTPSLVSAQTVPELKSQMVSVIEQIIDLEMDFQELGLQLPEKALRKGKADNRIAVKQLDSRLFHR